ncbi:putative RFC3-DNA replication factor C, 40 kDa subunit [Rhizophagus irregularis]|uniref:Putative RFC3-DNA replication factor C, 40 kDa subunit n=1 Tax=Rhizophagus irregularis TaxID=588596 RepID=A0A2N1P1M7_9GLOM|nr:putative RFC3-DNA replication factor C, 40 kDa subunit [Rhizophagus irregularis]
MSDNEIDTEETLPVLPSKNKGKGKAFPTKHDKEHLPWVEKYRPHTLSDLISLEYITSTLDKFIKERQFPHLLFYGPPGTGKTSTILACAKKLFGKDWNASVMELNASDERGIDMVREDIKGFASTRKLFSTGSEFKLVILDEADGLTNIAQNALRRIVEDYAKNVRFCFICNNVQRLNPALQSRCTRFRFRPLKQDQIRSRIEEIAMAENVNITENGIQALLKLCGGDMRRVLNILQSCSSRDVIDETVIYNCTGYPHPNDMESIMNSLTNDEFSTAYSKIKIFMENLSMSLNDIITEVVNYFKIYEFPLSGEALAYFFKNLRSIEHNLNTGGNSTIQLAALIGAYKNALKKADK